ncbi:nuclear transport factor 2 family protein [Acidovorax sp. sic0104]|uniref:nuclear transport factor 2 family protein n=1 Tax=Acidovorax sp. sic0104 TaxID=2854784 RepID=UPI001C4595A5|nr:nuclear transport factor 2 family protein [Acidovorax sp. sic0104]MBV7542794.1 nuclear transport factor 2 family protein [Acidovorax sp. sic0104]
MSTTPPRQTLIDLETKFWQAMVDENVDAAAALLAEPALLVSAHGALKFDRAMYGKMAQEGPMVVTSFTFSDMQVEFPTDAIGILTYRVKQGVAQRDDKAHSTEHVMHDSSTWIRVNGQWQCVMHTETPADDSMKLTAKH